MRNHWENKAWGTEERFGGCPIYPGQPFEILILVEPNAFKVRINIVNRIMCFRVLLNMNFMNLL